LKDTSDRKFLLMSHIYAGARVKHDNSYSTEDLWGERYDKAFFNEVRDHMDKIIMEVAGHDHWLDVRSYNDKHGDTFRNLLIGNALSPVRGQMPGYSRFKIEGQVAKGLIETSYDITDSYGKESVPSDYTLPKFVLDFEKSYGFEDLKANTIK